MTLPADNYALVTGASSGIGAVYAERLAKRGYNLILVARRGDRLQALASTIRASTERDVRTITADLSDRASSKGVEDTLRSNSKISLLLNCAGVGAVKPILGSDVEEMSELVRVNVEAVVRLTCAAVPSFVARGHGTIVNLSSAVAISTEVLNGVYSASKAFVLAFSQSLHAELSGKGIRVQVVLPGATATDIWANAGMPVENLPSEMVMQTETMVDAALAGLDRGEFMTSPSLPDIAEWDDFDKARLSLGQKLSFANAAERYRVG